MAIGLFIRHIREHPRWTSWSMVSPAFSRWEVQSGTVLGASFGGYVAQLLVRRRPHLVSQLILSNTGVPRRRLVPATRVVTALVRAMPWRILRRVLSRGFCKLIGADDLTNWSGRVLVIESDDDVNGPARRHALRDTYPQATVYTFQAAGHAPMFTRFVCRCG